jgi:excisionase family DNA binding protein
MPCACDKTASDHNGGTDAPERLLLSETEIAALCSVSRHTVRRWVAAGKLHPVELPYGMRRKLYRRSEVEGFVAGLDLQAQASAT